MSNFVCLICNSIVDTKLKLSAHVRSKHHLSAKEYYDTYLKQPGEGICHRKGCNKPTRFDRGCYRIYCSTLCKSLSKEVQEKTKQTMIERYGGPTPYQSPVIMERIRENNLKNFGYENPYMQPHVIEKAHRNLKENNKKYVEKFEKENNCTWRKTLIDKYGNGWIKYLDIETIHSNNFAFIRNSDIPLIEDYCNNKYKHLENSILSYIREFYSEEIKRNESTLIKPYQLDFYFPDLRLAIECDGSWWHSIEAGIYNKDYHLMKTKMCEDQDIRLIHIFGDNWDSYKNIIKDAILNQDRIQNKNEIVLDRSKDNIKLYLDNGYKIIKYIEPAIIKIDFLSLYDCGKIVVQSEG